jgi:HAUS augmin-like complex subunit 7
LVISVVFQNEEPSDSSLEHTGQTLELVVGELCQLAVNFTYCFENEFQPWCDKSPPMLSQLGPAVKRVHSLLQHFAQVKKNVSKLCIMWEFLC